MADPINEFIGIMRQEGKFHNEPSFFIGKIKSKLPDLKIEINNIILEKEDILIDSWMLDRQIELFDTETSQEHKHEIKNPFIDTFSPILNIITVSPDSKVSIKGFFISCLCS